MRLVAAGVLLISLLSGCKGMSKSPALTYTEVGRLVSVQHISAGWDQSEMSVVRTTKGTFQIEGCISGITGAAVRLSSEGYLFIDGTTYGKPADGYYDWNGQ